MTMGWPRELDLNLMVRLLNGCVVSLTSQYLQYGRPLKLVSTLGVA
jgi:hypothetical protein